MKLHSDTLDKELVETLLNQAESEGKLREVTQERDKLLKKIDKLEDDIWGHLVQDARSSTSSPYSPPHTSPSPSHASSSSSSSSALPNDPLIKSHDERKHESTFFLSPSNYEAFAKKINSLEAQLETSRKNEQSSLDYSLKQTLQVESLREQLLREAEAIQFTQTKSAKTLNDVNRALAVERRDNKLLKERIQELSNEMSLLRSGGLLTHSPPGETVKRGGIFFATRKT